MQIILCNEFGKGITNCTYASATNLGPLVRWEVAAELGQPASPFQLSIIQRLWAGEQPYTTFAFFQCQLGAESSKPTRLVTSLKSPADA